MNRGYIQFKNSKKYEDCCNDHTYPQRPQICHVFSFIDANIFNRHALQRFFLFAIFCVARNLVPVFSYIKTHFLYIIFCVVLYAEPVYSHKALTKLCGNLPSFKYKDL